jgi:hypothetical protein
MRQHSTEKQYGNLVRTNALANRLDVRCEPLRELVEGLAAGYWHSQASSNFFAIRR